MNEVNETLYIPLYGKALVSRQGILLRDPKAEEIWAKEGFALKGKAASKWLAFYMGMRARVFDDWLTQKLAEVPDGVVLHIGCGMDSRVCRAAHEGHLWFDIDFPEVISQRQRHYPSMDGYEMIASDARDTAYLSRMPKGTAIVIMEGISMYLQPTELQKLLSDLNQHFAQVHLLMDCYTDFAAKASRYKNPVNTVGVTTLYGIDDPKAMEISGMRFCQERDLTPEHLIRELQGFERRFFRKMFAGSLARKMYRLYEFSSFGP